MNLDLKEEKAERTVGSEGRAIWAEEIARAKALRRDYTCDGGCGGQATWDSMGFRAGCVTDGI